MKTLTQDSNNDIILDGNGQISVSSDIDAYKFILEDAVRTILGEVQLNTNMGVPYFTTVFSDKRDILLWKDRMKEIVMGYDFVLSVYNFDVKVDYMNKTLSYTMNITTTSGDITISS